MNQGHFTYMLTFTIHLHSAYTNKDFRIITAVHFLKCLYHLNHLSQICCHKSGPYSTYNMGCYCLPVFYFFFSTLDPSLTNLLQNEGAWGTGTTSNRVSITSWHTCSLGCDMTHTRTLADYIIRWCLLWNPRTLFWNSLVPPALYENQTRTSGRLRKNHNFFLSEFNF